MIKLYEIMNAVYLILNKDTSINTCICNNKYIYKSGKIPIVLNEATEYKKSLTALKICLSNKSIYFKNTDELFNLNKQNVIKIVDKISDTDTDTDTDTDKDKV